MLPGPRAAAFGRESEQPAAGGVPAASREGSAGPKATANTSETRSGMWLFSFITWPGSRARPPTVAPPACGPGDCRGEPLGGVGHPGLCPLNASSSPVWAPRTVCRSCGAPWGSVRLVRASAGRVAAKAPRSPLSSPIPSAPRLLQLLTGQALGDVPSSACGGAAASP